MANKKKFENGKPVDAEDSDDSEEESDSSEEDESE